MSDETLPERVVLAAVYAAGPMNNPAQWRAKVNELVPQIASMVRGPQTVGDNVKRGAPLWHLAADVMEAEHFPAELHSWEIEQSTTRVLVTLKTEPSKRYPEGLEPIRTERTDSSRGKAMLRRIEEAGVGARILVYKKMEDMAGRSGEQVRILVHFDVLEPGARGGTADAPASSTGAARREGSTPSERTEATEQQQRDPLAKRFSSLPAKTMATVARRARAEGIVVPVPADEHRARLEQIINEEEA